MHRVYSYTPCRFCRFSDNNSPHCIMAYRAEAAELWESSTSSYCFLVCNPCCGDPNQDLCKTMVAVAPFGIPCHRFPRFKSSRVDFDMVVICAHISYRIVRLDKEIPATQMVGSAHTGAYSGGNKHVALYSSCEGLLILTAEMDSTPQPLKKRFTSPPSAGNPLM